MTTGAGKYVTVRLGGGCPWGFRLQGGEGTGKTLTVAKVRTKSKSFGKLQVGDVIVRCNDQPCNRLTYDEVMILADKGSPNLVLLIYRTEKANQAFESKKISDVQSDDSYKRSREEDFTTEYRSKITKQSEVFKVKPVSLLPRLPKPFLKMSEKEEIETEQLNTEESMDTGESQVNGYPEDQKSDVVIDEEKIEEVEKAEVSETEVKEVEETLQNSIDQQQSDESISELEPESESSCQKLEDINDSNKENVIEQEKQTVDGDLETKTEIYNDIGQTINVSEFEQHAVVNHSVTETMMSSVSVASTVMTSSDSEQDQPLLGMNSTFTEGKRDIHQLNRKIYQPPSDYNMEISIPRKKKMFSSSSFYEEPNAIYPTVEEQVELCRKIADSLSSDKNKKSRGANMFFRRVTKSEKWIHEGPDPISSDSDSYFDANDVSTPDPNKYPFVKVSKGPPKLKLILDPRQLQDMVKLRSSGQNINEHNVVSPDICLGIVKDLNSPTGKGAMLFAKRKKKSEEWVVDEEKVKSHLKSDYDYRYQKQESVQNQRLKMIKSPWAAAMESPIGSCDAAFVDVHPDRVAETVIKAAEEKTKIDTSKPLFPVKLPTSEPKIQKQVTKPQSSSKVDPYRPRAPRGWSGTFDASSLFTRTELPPAPLPIIPSTELSQEKQAPKYKFNNFNNTAKAWTGSSESTFNFKTVKPPSLLIK
ncbi:synaptopodin-2-like isoform X1 [Centruroides sculpturatus]|uniref:synaptopodin-2-like isoform X1 n=2 Tax=Centruroides sculpturatus TaxID=218467 RepID=UPI000C6CA8F2|nr:synaptopodin-2-like isoform X1 [Centruroides sculpturatus]